MKIHHFGLSIVICLIVTGCSNLYSVEIKEQLLVEKHVQKTIELNAKRYDLNGFLVVKVEEELESEIVESPPVVEVKPTPADKPKEEEKPKQEEKPKKKDVPKEEAIPVVSNPTAVAVVVNKQRALPKNHRPNDLVRPNVRFSFGDKKVENALLRKEASKALEKMFHSAEAENIIFYARSGYRSYETQSWLFDQEIKNYGYEKAVLYVARPGTSEHQTGLAMDITAKSVNLQLTEKFEKTEEGKWLASHAHEYGFILRYPKGKTDITGYAFEPWHFRYIGVELATEVFNSGLTLEEYMNGIGEI
ncbi:MULTISPECIES: M15 family metallopeptidase [Bacillus]|uniref:M15 family metallopeptidase n=1 Tax=Bacillus TaxID=1386 RepID=UPI001D0D65E1|nr:MULTISPECIES: M15 family metallopeptidase [Bacillus]